MLLLLTWLLESFKLLAWPTFMAHIVFLLGGAGTEHRGWKGPWAMESRGCPFHTRKHPESAVPDVTRVRGQAVGTGTLLPGSLWFGGRRALTRGVGTGGGPQVVLGSRGLWEKPQTRDAALWRLTPTTPTSPHPPARSCHCPLAMPTARPDICSTGDFCG